MVKKESILKIQIYILSLSLVQLFAQDQPCKCEELFLATDCMSCSDSVNCIWENQQCREKKCSDYKDSKSCTWYSNYRQENIPQCFWKEQNSTCIEWNNCQQIEVSQLNGYDCSYYGCPEEINSNSTKCKDIILNLTYIPSPTYLPCQQLPISICNDYHNHAGQVCFWNSTTQKCNKYEFCSQILNNNTCSYFEKCEFVNETCYEKKCEIYTPQQCATSFVTVLNSVDKQFLICKLDIDGKKCIEGISSDLNKSSCYEQTQFMFSFDSQKCRKCGKIAFSTIKRHIFRLILILLTIT